MNQISNTARLDLRNTENVWSAPTAPTIDYDKDGNPATVVVQFRSEYRPAPVVEAAPRAQAPAMNIPRSSFADYDDGNPGTVLA